MIEGGTGDDTFFGSSHEDTYIYNLGDGKDTILEAGGNARLCFGEGVDFNELWFSRTDNDLSINIIGTEDSVTIKKLVCQYQLPD